LLPAELRWLIGDQHFSDSLRWPAAAQRRTISVISLADLDSRKIAPFSSVWTQERPSNVELIEQTTPHHAPFVYNADRS
jgi:hypothetical protein